MAERRIWPVILSGGAGSRLWPVSRALYPKQLIRLAGDRTMIQDTALRVADTALFADPVVVAGDAHRFTIVEQLADVGVTPAALILEPQGRNTAPAVALAGHWIAGQDPDALMLVMPSDHVIGDVAAFLAAVGTGRTAAEAGSLVTFGVVPTAPETGYGYIKKAEQHADATGCYRVDRFVEKPDAATAQRYLDSGRYLWNSGLFLLPVGGYLEELETHAPEMAHTTRTAMDQAARDGDFLRPDADAFAACPSDSIDYAVMEKTANAVVVPADMAWSDLGSWSSVWDIRDKQADGTVAVGDVIAVDAANCLLLNDEGPTVAALGVDDLVVVATKDAVLVTPRDRAQDVKRIVDALKQAGSDQHHAHAVVHRPWGSYETTASGNRFQTRRIVVKPGHRLSPQRHQDRAEHWVVVQGTAKVIRGDEELTLSENDYVYIPAGTEHRLENPGDTPLHLIEIQSGSTLGEDDVTRLDDG